MSTVRDLIRESLLDITVIGAGENMTPEDAADGLSSLNEMLDSWSTDGTVIYGKSFDSIPLTALDQTYTMGPSGDINTVRPIAITQASVNLGQIQYPLNIWSQNAISALSFPTIPAAIPTDLYVNNTYPLLQLFIYPACASGLILHIYSLKPLTNLALNDTLELPPGYKKALRKNLAVTMAPQYEREASRTVQNDAYDGLQAIKRNNNQYSPPTMAVEGILLVNNSTNQNWFNIWGGF